MHLPNLIAQSTNFDSIFFTKRYGKTIAVRKKDNIFGVSEEKITREVLGKRAELLFSSAVILCEGITEELVLPVYFQEYFGRTPYSLGVNIIGIGGLNYKPYLSLVKDINIPWFIFSDGDDSAIKSISKAIEDIFERQYTDFDEILIIPNKLNYEQYIISEGYADNIHEVICELMGNINALQSYIIERKNQKGRGGVVRNYDGEFGWENALIDCYLEYKIELALPVAKKLLPLVM
jgi:putative ATP-dependent endonuclease of OLD family